MRKLRGTLNNITAPVLVKIQKQETENYCFNPDVWDIIEDESISPTYHIKTGLIVPPGFKTSSTSLPFFELSNWNHRPNVGDVVLLSQNECSVLFDTDSTSNSILLSEKCDCNCIMCPQFQTGVTDDACFSLAIRTINLIPKKVEWIGFTGGEPTLNWENLISLVKLCNSVLPTTKIHLLTNAHAFKQWEKAVEISNLLKDRIYVSVPLYSDNAADHDQIVGKKGAFYETIAGILNLENANIPIELRNVLLPQNMNRLEKWACFVYMNLPFVHCVALMDLEHEGKARISVDSLSLHTEEYSQALIVTANAFKRYSINFKLYNFPLCNLPKALWKHSHKAISEWKRDFSEECINCVEKENCGGFFSSTDYKNRINPITKRDLI